MGGEGNDSNRLDDIEKLHLDTTTTGREWHPCATTLPFKLYKYCVTTFQKNIILTGGYVDGEGISSKQVYQGSISKEGDDVEWHELPEMNAGRQDHMAINYHCLLYTSPSPRDS